MATSSNLSIPEINSEESSVQNQISSDQGNYSPSAFGGSAPPTSNDITTQQDVTKLQTQLQTLDDQKLQQQWYGPTANSTTTTNTPDEGAPPEGLVGKATDVLQGPLRAIVGAVQHATGQGKTGSLLGDIQDNLANRKETFGNVLSDAGAPYAVAAPLGLALDITADPVNWFTMGDSALIPRLATGLVKGAADSGVAGATEGLGLAAKSGLLNKAVTVGKFIPGVKNTSVFSKLAGSALQSTSDYENLVGRTAADVVQQRGFGVGSYRVGLGQVINQAASSIPGGQAILKNFIYDPVNWVREARIKDVLQQSLGTGADLKGAINAYANGEDVTPFLGKVGDETTPSTGLAAEMETKIKSMPAGSARIDFDTPETPSMSKDAEAAVDSLANTPEGDAASAAAPKIVNGIDDAATLMQQPTLGLTDDPVENAMRIANETIGGPAITLDDLSKIVNTGALGDTGVQWYDNMMKGIRGLQLQVGSNSNNVIKYGQKVMDAYDQAMSIFRHAKVGASPGTWMNMVIGNAAMQHMMGVDITDPTWWSRVNQIRGLYANKTGSAALLDDLLMNADVEGDSIRRFLTDNPTAASRTFGAPVSSIVGSKYIAQRVLSAAKDANLIPETATADDLEKPLSEAMKELQAVAAGTPTSAEGLGGVEGGLSQMKGILDKPGVSQSDLPSGMLENEMFSTNASRKMFEYMAQKASQPGANPVWKVLDGVFNKASSGYAAIDQVYKMASFVRGTVDGYTLPELTKMRHFVDINPEDLTKYAQEGTWRYRLSPQKALEVANVASVNYNAMPAAIRVLRNMPLLGSPFASFAYAMALKTGQTLAYNPSAFNKISFALNDFGGQKSPLEKSALNSQYYSYLNQPGMFRVPFFDQNPLYIDMTRMLPYYSMNAFTQSEQNYDTSMLPGKLLATVQGSPLLKDPVGQTIFNYLIQPMILGNSQPPEGEFGQVIYPYGATGLQKAGYGARDLAESFIPNVAAYTGLVPGAANIAPYVPSYRWRQLAEAEVGKNQYGISGKEPAISRTIRSVLSSTGVPVEAPVNLTYQPNSSTQ